MQLVQKFTANAKIHGKRQNSRLPWSPWIRDFRLALMISTFSVYILWLGLIFMPVPVYGLNFWSGLCDILGNFNG